MNNDLTYIALTVAFFVLTVGLAAFAERIMPQPTRDRADEAREELP